MTQHIIVDSAVPSVAPDHPGIHYVLTDGTRGWNSIGTDGVWDWVETNGGGGYNASTINDHGTDPANFTIDMDDTDQSHILISTGAAITVTFAAPADTTRVYRRILRWEPSGTPTAPIMAYTGGTNRFTQGTIGTAWQMIVVYFIGNDDFITLVFN